MFYLGLCIASSTMMIFIFKWFQRFGVHTFSAILVNYLVAMACSAFSSGGIEAGHITGEPFLPLAGILGLCFVSIFSLMAYTTQKAGATVTSVSGRMSLVIPVLFGILYLGQTAGALKITGIAVALPAVIFASVKGRGNMDMKYFHLPFLLFFGNGLVDLLISYSQHHYVTEEKSGLFTFCLFAAAFTTGLVYYLVTGSHKNARNRIVSTLTGGIVLGFFNYLSLFSAIGALNSGMESSVFFPFNNIGIIVTTAIGSWLIFREKLSVVNWLGITLGIIAIIFTGWEALKGIFGSI